MTKKRQIAYLALLGNTVLWGLAIPIVKRAFGAGLTPTVFLFGRYLVAVLASIPIVWLIRHRSGVKRVFKPKNVFRVAALEFVGTVLALWLLYEGVARTSAVEASLIAVTWPIFVTVGGVWLLKEREERHEILGLGLALWGTFILILEPLLAAGVKSLNFRGNLLILAQNIVITGYYLSAKRHYAKLNKWAVTHVSFWIGLVSFGLIISFTGGGGPSYQLLTSSYSLWPLAAILYMGIAGSILGLTLYLIGQDKIEASEAAVFTYLQPLVAIPASILMLRESVSYLQVLAMMVIAVGVFLTERRRKLI